MAKNQAAKKTRVAEADPFGPGFAKFVEKSFEQSVEAARKSLKEEGLDRYGTVDGKLAAKKPDGQIVFKPEKKTHG